MPKKKDSCCAPKLYPSHDKQLPKLNRISGQIEGVKRMIAERRYCPDILTQLHAARAALRAIEAEILMVYIDSCVTDAFHSGDDADRLQKMKELKKLYQQNGK